MSNNSGKIKFSNSGIEIAYRRFVSDCAPGLILIAAIIILYPFHDTFIIKYDNNAQTKIALYIMLFLISSPLGLAINAVNYLFLDKIVHWIEEYFVKKLLYKEYLFSGDGIPGNDDGRLIEFPKHNFRSNIASNMNKIRTFKKSFLITAAADEFLWDSMCKNAFNDNWIKNTRCIVKIMDIYHHDRYEAHEHEVGAHVLLRDLAFVIIIILVIDILILLVKQDVSLFIRSEPYFGPYIYVLFFIVFLLLLGCSAFVSYYYNLALLCDAYIIHLKCEKKMKPHIVDPIKICLNCTEKNKIIIP